MIIIEWLPTAGLGLYALFLLALLFKEKLEMKFELGCPFISSGTAIFTSVVSLRWAAAV